MSSPDVFIGIDFSEGELVIAALPQNQIWKASNEPWGLTELVQRLATLGPRVVAIESARGMERPVQRLLEEAGLSVLIVSRLRIRDFLCGQDFSTTGAGHSMALAKYGQSVAFEIPGESKAGELKSLLMRHGQLEEMITTEKNRCKIGSKRVRFDVEAHISWLEKRLRANNNDISGYIKKLPIWSQQKRAIKIVPGAGPVWGIASLSFLALWVTAGII